MLSIGAEKNKIGAEVRRRGIGAEPKICIIHKTKFDTFGLSHIYTT
jgi:hypothetical protein